jgi:hypothetical protein
MLKYNIAIYIICGGWEESWENGNQFKFESEPESELLWNWRFTANQYVLATSPLTLTTSNFIFQLNTCSYSLYVTSSLTRERVCLWQLLLVFASTLILRSDTRGTRGHILLSQIQDSSNLQGQVLVFKSPQGTGWPSYTHRHWVPFFVAFYNSQGYCGNIRPRLHTREFKFEIHRNVLCN